MTEIFCQKENCNHNILLEDVAYCNHTSIIITKNGCSSYSPKRPAAQSISKSSTTTGNAVATVQGGAEVLNPKTTKLVMRRLKEAKQGKTITSEELRERLKKLRLQTYG
jgi:hypothetical protein